MSRTVPPMPPLSSVLKAPAVEDPVNVYVHRPLAYLIVMAVRHTGMTPNQITFLSMVTGIAAGGLFLWGVPAAMITGGALVWASAILDGADGILARVKNMGSDIGRALDGTADAVVGACTVFPAMAHLWLEHHDPTHLWAAVLAIGSALLHIYLYDFYKEQYLRALQPQKYAGGVEAEQARHLRLQREGGPFYARAAVKASLDMQRAQRAIVTRVNSLMFSERFWSAMQQVGADELYRRHNSAPMRAWALISFCPHSYIMAICAMLDRLEVYLWIRLIGMNAIFIPLLFWQRMATQRTLAELERSRVSEPALSSSR